MLKWYEREPKDKERVKERKEALKISVSAPLYQMGPVEQRYESTGRFTLPYDLHTVSCVCVCVKGPLAEVIVLFIFHSLEPEPCKVLKHKVIIL